MRIGLLGCGLWGERILAELNAMQVPTTVVDPDPQARQRALDAGARSVREQLPVVAGVDGWIIATAASDHAACLRSLAPFALPILCEKPLAPSAAALIDVQKLGLERCHMLDVWRYHAAVEALQAIVASGELGAPLGLRSTRTNWTSPRTDVDSLWNLAPHEVSIYVQIFGEYPQPVAALAELHDGQARGLYAHWHGGPWLVSELGNRSPTRRRELRLHCRDGVASFDDERPDVLTVASGPADPALQARDRVVRTLVPTSALRRQLQSWVDYLRGGPPPRSNLQHGIATVQSMLRLRELAGLAS